MKFGAIYCLYDDHEYLEPSLFPNSGHLDKVLFLISDVPWNGKKSDNSETISKVKELCSKVENFELIEGHWTNEIDQRNFGLSKFFKWGIDYAFIIDSDEIYRERDFLNIMEFVTQNQQYDAYHVEWNTYWKKGYYRITPREDYKPVIIVRVSHFKFTIIRGGITSVLRTESAVLTTRDNLYNSVLIPPNIAICYHLSYARKDDYMIRKMETNSHAPEFIDGWIDKVWMKWTPQMRNLHPVTPAQYNIALPEDFVEFPDQLKIFIKKERMNSRKCSIIILNWNSCDLLKRCLELVGSNTQDIPYEIIVVDNGSTKDNSVEFIKSLECKKIFNETNLGFVPAVNQAMKLTQGTDVCLLNVDAEVQPRWLSEMYETMINNSIAGMVGPLGNEVTSGHQREGQVNQDCIVPNLYGYCLLILRELIDKIGYLDPRYKIGGWDDADYGIRAKLSGYDLFISAKSLVRHKAHQVYDRNGVDHYKQDGINREIYLNKFFGALLNYGQIYNLFDNEFMARASGLVIDE